MKKLDEDNMQLKAEKYGLDQDSIDWLGYKLTRTCISSVTAQIRD